jgi:hypothetical protein
MGGIGASASGCSRSVGVCLDPGSRRSTHVRCGVPERLLDDASEGSPDRQLADAARFRAPSGRHIRRICAASGGCHANALIDRLVIAVGFGGIRQTRRFSELHPQAAHCDCCVNRLRVRCWLAAAGIDARLSVDTDRLGDHVRAALRSWVDRARAMLEAKIDSFGELMNGRATADALGSRDFFRGRGFPLASRGSDGCLGRQ